MAPCMPIREAREVVVEATPEEILAVLADVALVPQWITPRWGWATGYFKAKNG